MVCCYAQAEHDKGVSVGAFGVDFEVIHLNEEALDGATARMPLEEVFAADISDEILVFLRGDRRFTSI